jgi:predicted kinase
MSTYVLMAGLPGTGKTALAEALAGELEGVVLNKDTLRAAIFPGPLTDYSREQDDLCFSMLLDAARYLSSRKRPPFLFLDGRTFSRRQQIDDALQAAESAGCQWKILLAICPDEIAEVRLIHDAGKHPAANRTVELYREMKARFEAIDRPHASIDTSQPLPVSVVAATQYLLTGAQP